MPEPEWFDQARRDAAAIKQAIHELESKYSGNIFAGEVDYRDLREDAQAVRAMFKGKRLLYEHRQPLWEELSALCDRLFSARNAQREKRELHSEQKKRDVLNVLSSAEAVIQASSDYDSFTRAAEILAQALAMMKPGWSGYSVTTEFATLSEGRLTKADNDICWERYKSLQQMLHQRRKQVSDDNYQSAMASAHQAVNYAESAGRLKDASEQLKAVASSIKNVYMHKDQRTIVYETLTQGFETLSRRVEERKDVTAQKKREWQERQENRINRLEDALERKRDYLSRLHDQISHLQSEIYSSSNPNWISKAEGWIDEKEDKIREVEGVIRDIENSLAEVRRNL